MNSEKELKLPVIKGITHSAKCLSMDDYLRFVIVNLKFVTGRKKHTKGRKKPAAVNVSFNI